MMKKLFTLILSSIILVALLAMLSGAVLSTHEELPVAGLSTGSVDLSLDIQALGQVPGPGTDAGEYYIPGDCIGYQITITNDGISEARWRLGVCPEGPLPGEHNDAAFQDQIILTFFKLDSENPGQWTMIKSEKMGNFMLPERPPYPQDRWVYDTDQEESGFHLKPGESDRIIMQIDYDLTAEKNAQRGQFNGSILLEGAQANAENWWPSDG